MVSANKPSMGSSHDGKPAVAGTQFLTVAEVATLMRVSKMTVYRLVHSGELACCTSGPFVPCTCEGSTRLPRNLVLRCRLTSRFEEDDLGVSRVAGTAVAVPEARFMPSDSTPVR